MELNNVDYDQLLVASGLVVHTWEVGALCCLQAGPLSYTDVGTRLGAWSGLRPADSTITRALKRLEIAGFVVHHDGEDSRRGTYEITASGLARIAEVAGLVARLDHDQ